MRKKHDLESLSRLVNESASELHDIVELWRRREIDPELLFDSVKKIAYKLTDASNGE